MFNIYRACVTVLTSLEWIRHPPKTLLMLKSLLFILVRLLTHSSHYDFHIAAQSLQLWVGEASSHAIDRARITLLGNIVSHIPLKKQDTERKKT